jgi:hypothetical protein
MQLTARISKALIGSNNYDSAATMLALLIVLILIAVMYANREIRGPEYCGTAGAIDATTNAAMTSSLATAWQPDATAEQPDVLGFAREGSSDVSTSASSMLYSIDRSA